MSIKVLPEAGATLALSVKAWPLWAWLGWASVVTVAVGAFEPVPAAKATAGAAARPLIAEMMRARVNARDIVDLLDLVVAVAGGSHEIQRDTDKRFRNSRAANP
jgi:hypothetical protein